MKDEGSALGRFWYKIFKGNKLCTNFCTRGTIGILLSITMLSIPIITGYWVSFGIGSLIIILTWALISWRGFGETKIKIFNKEYALLNVDLVVYGTTACAFVLIINGWAG